MNGPAAGKILVGLGEVLWDVYPDGRRLGGAPANAAVHGHRMGAEAAVASAVGMDEPGETIVRDLSGQGIDTLCIQIQSGRATGTVLVRLDSKGRLLNIPYRRWKDSFAYRKACKNRPASVRVQGRIHRIGRTDRGRREKRQRVQN